MGGSNSTRLFLAIALVAASFIRQYSIYTRIEYALFLSLLLADSSSSFCICISVKVFVCLLFFIRDYVSKLVSAKVDPRLLIRYMIGSWGQPYQALIAFRDEMFHCSQDLGIGISGHPLGVEDRTLFLDVRQHPIPFSTLHHKMFFSLSCAGFPVPNIGTSIHEQRLEVCVKKHDWAVTAIYVLSCHKFLSYSIVSFVRKLTWAGCVNLAISIHLLAEFESSETHSHLVTLCDCTLMSITLFDVINSVEFKVEDNDDEVHTVFSRNCYVKIVKLFIMCTFVILIQKSPLYDVVSRYGYFVYIGVCLLCAAVVHSMTSRSLARSNAHLDNPLLPVPDQKA